MKNGKDLLEFAMEAHGGFDHWNSFNSLTTHVKIGGATWPLKQQDGIINDSRFQLRLHEQWASFLDFKAKGHRSVFQPGRVAEYDDAGKVISELLSPRDSFVNHTLTTPWNELQMVYFASYAMWTYFNAPFLFAAPGFEVSELDSWREGNETLRRLEVIFPDHIATHSKRQIFYYGESGLLARHDYWPDVLAGTPAVQIASEYQSFSGIKMATRRRIYPLNPDNSYLTDPLLVSIDIVAATFE